jgi:PAS domain S-box-containing protein
VVTSEPLQVDQATVALRAAVPDLDDYIDKGQIEILDYSQWYTRSGKFSADKVLQGWVDKLNAAQERGYEGLRLTGNTFWLEKPDWDDFTRYEETVNNVIGRYHMLAIYTYSIQKCNAVELLDVVANHQFALIKRSGHWEIIESNQHKKTEQALRDSEEKLSALHASMAEGVALHEIIYDELDNPVDYVITDVNPSFEKITGFSREKVLGQKASEIYGINEPPYLDVYSRVASSGKAESFETYFPPMKKHFSISVFSPSRGKFATVFSDITEHKRIEEDLKKAEEQSRLMVKYAPSIIYEIDFRGHRFVSVNDVMCSVLGYTREELLAKNPLELLEGKSKEIFQDRIRKYLAGEKLSDSIEYTARTKDGRLVYGLLNISFTFGGGKPIGAVVVAQDITERKQAEIALQEANEELEVAAEELRQQNDELLRTQSTLQESEERFRTLAENIPDQITRFDRNLRLLYANPAVLQRTGLPGETLVGRTASEYGASTTAAALWEKVASEVLESGEPRRYEHTSLWQGETRILDVQMVPERDADGTVRAVIAIARDITERKRAETALQEVNEELELISEELRQQNEELISTHSALRESEQKYSLLFERSAVAASLTKLPENVFADVNEAFEKLFGYEKLEVVGKTSLELGIAKSEEHAVTVAEIEGRGLQHDAEKHVRTKSGEERIILLNVSVLELGGQKYTLSTMQDITERKRAEEALRESEEKYRTIVETANEGIWTVDEQLITTFVNEKMSEMLGYDPHEMIGMYAFNFMDEEGKALASKRLERRVQGIKGSYEHKYLRKDGSPVWTIANVTPLKDSEGKFAGSIGLLTDITEHKHLDEMLRQTSERLDMAQRASGAGTWDWNILTSHLIWSSELFDLFGLDPQKSAASFEAWNSVMHPEDREIANFRIDQALREHTNLDSEYRIMMPDGQIRWINALGRGTYDDRDRPVRMIGICIDITDRKRTEEALRDSEERYRTRFNALIEGFCVIEMVFDEAKNPSIIVSLKSIRLLKGKPVYMTRREN